VNKDFSFKDEYDSGFSLDDFFLVQSLGIEFGSKEYFLDSDKHNLTRFIKDVILNTTVTEKEIETLFGIKTTSGWRFDSLRRKEISSGFKPEKIKACVNAPFDNRFTYHSDILRRSQHEVLKNMYLKNISLITLRQSRTTNSFCYYLTKELFSKDVISILDRATGFPLYVYSGINDQLTIGLTNERTPNLKPEIVKKIAESIGLTFTSEKETTENTFAPIDLLDYIYAVLHSPTYREKYKEFLKIDFPRVPYPKDQQTFWQLVKLGGELRQIHLLESPIVNKPITSYPIDGNNRVENIKAMPINETTVPVVYVRAFINSTQYFDNIPAVAWNFYIGGYQPAQKWLKDRKDRQLEFDDILHYQKIIVALTETDRLMKEIDQISFE